MKAIILAAGEGNRLRPHTLDRPKCMVELLGGPLILRQLNTLRSAGVENITLVTGYCASKLVDLGVATRHNPNFAITNMVYTLMCARDLLNGEEDVLITYSDIVYERRILDAILDSNSPMSTTVDSNWQNLWGARNEDPMNDAETMRVDRDSNIIELGKKPTSLQEIEGQYMGLIKVRADHVVTFVEHYDSLDNDALYDGKEFSKMYMTSFLQSLIQSGHPIRAVNVEGGWLEVDTTEDLALYERLHNCGQLEALISLDSRA